MNKQEKQKRANAEGARIHYRKMMPVPDANGAVPLVLRCEKCGVENYDVNLFEYFADSLAHSEVFCNKCDPFVGKKAREARERCLVCAPERLQRGTYTAEMIAASR